MRPYDKLASIYDGLFAEPYYRQYERFIGRATRLRGGRALDVACGTGRLGARLIRRGFEVTGVDRSAAMLARAKRRGLRVRRASLGSFRVPGRFDLATCTFDSLNHLSSLAGVFRSVARALAPGGWFLFDLNTPFKINAVCPSYRARRFRRGGCEIFWLHEIARDRWMSRITIFEGSRRYEETIRERCFPRSKVEGWLRAAGLAVEGVYADLKFGIVQPTSERWYYVVRKKHGPGNSGKNRRRSGLQ